jgi:hypothetical protein
MRAATAGAGPSIRGKKASDIDKGHAIRFRAIAQEA